MDEIPEGWDKELYNKLSFDFLVACVKNKKIDEWNSLYLKYLESEINRLYPKKKLDPKDRVRILMADDLLIGPDFSGADFQKAHLEGAYLLRVNLKGANFREAHLEGAWIWGAHLEGTDFWRAHLKGANISGAHLEGTDFWRAHLKGANISGAYLEEADFSGGYLEGADFSEAYLEGADFMVTDLKGINFMDAHLGGVDFRSANLDGAQFTYTIVDGGTLFTNNHIDKNTDFTGTALSATRITPNLRTKLERNIREIQWKKWYCKSKISPLRFLRKLTRKIYENEKDAKENECYPSLTDRIFINPLVRLFWCLTDYGNSTKRVIGVFFAWNILWAFIYQFLLPLQQGPILENASTMVLDTPNIITAVMQTNLMMFSITDVATRNLDYPALIFVTVQIVIGYFILAALITRLGIMFQNLSP